MAPPGRSRTSWTLLPGGGAPSPRAGGRLGGGGGLPPRAGPPSVRFGDPPDRWISRAGSGPGPPVGGWAWGGLSSPPALPPVWPCLAFGHPLRGRKSTFPIEGLTRTKGMESSSEILRWTDYSGFSLDHLIFISVRWPFWLKAKFLSQAILVPRLRMADLRRCLTCPVVLDAGTYVCPEATPTARLAGRCRNCSVLVGTALEQGRPQYDRTLARLRPAVDELRRPDPADRA